MASTQQIKARIKSVNIWNMKNEIRKMVFAATHVPCSMFHISLGGTN